MSETLFTYYYHLDDKETEITSIRCYGINKHKQTVCLHIKDFTPWCYLELPSNIQWTVDKCQLLSSKLDELLRNKRPLKKQLIYKKKLYGYSLSKFPYLFMSFSNKGDIRALSYIVKKSISVAGIGYIKLKLHEEVDPILQMTSYNNINIGWIHFNAKNIVDECDKITNADIEYNVSFRKLKKSDIISEVYPKILAFDLEVNSTNVTAMPKASNSGDVIFQISCCLQHENIITKYLLSLGDPDCNTVGTDTIVLKFINESDLILGFTQLINDLNPNVICGYNIMGFDIPYLIDRANFNFVIGDFSKLGFHTTEKGIVKKIKWTSSAFKDQEFEYIEAEGRIFVDLLPLIKRDYKLDNYRLKTVSEMFIGDTKNDLSVSGIFKCYRMGIINDNGVYAKKAQIMMGKCGRYCVQDSLLCLKLMQKLDTWVGLCEMAKTCNTSIFALYTQGQQIKVFSQVYTYCLKNGIVVEKDGYIAEDNERYVGAYVFTPVPGLYDNVVPFDFMSLYPTTIIAYNIDYSTLVLDDTVPDRLCNVMKWEDHQNCSHDPKVIRKQTLTEYIKTEKTEISNLRAMRDKAANRSRKPEIIKEIDDRVLALKPYTDEKIALTKSISKNIICGERNYRFIKEPKGVIPIILQNLLDARKNTRKSIKENKVMIDNITDENQILYLMSLNNMLDKRQLSYKVSANSMYGSWGVRKGYLPFMPGAMVTTYMGRKNIERAAQMITNDYGGTLIYGDTDSNYVVFPELTSIKDTWEYAINVSEKISKTFPSPIYLEFEHAIYTQFFILTKKRYMYKSSDINGNVDDKIGKRGVLLARRDNSKFIKSLYESLINLIFLNTSYDDVTYHIVCELNKLFSKSIDNTQFIITKAVGDTNEFTVEPFINEKGIKKVKIGSYIVPFVSIDEDERITQLNKKNAVDTKEFYLKSLPAIVQLAEKMKQRGMRVENGSRVEYVILTNIDKNAKQYEKVESYEYYKKHCDVLKIDYFYYLKLMINPVDEVINVAFKGKKDFIKDQYLIRSNHLKTINEIKSMFAPLITYL